MPMDFFAQRMAGDLAARQAQNDVVAKVLAGMLAPTAIQGLFLIFYLIFMFRYSVVLSLIGVATGVINFEMTI